MKRAKPGKSLYELFPDLCNEWNFEKNSAFDPKTLSYGSRVKIWWKCVRGHEWKTAISNRTGLGNGCPKCVSATSDFEIRLYSEVKYFFPQTENRFRLKGREVDIFIPELNVAVEFDGFYWHKDKFQKDNQKASFIKGLGVILVRIRDEGLKLQPNDLCVPRLKKSKNDINSLFIYLRRFVSDLRIRKRLFKYIKRKTYINETLYKDLLFSLPGPLPGKTLKDVFPNLAKEWHPDRNGSLSPKKVSSSSGRVVWWKCHKGHEWRTKVAHRSKGSGCPFCKGNRLSDENRLSIIRPDLVLQWDPSKNSIKPDSVTANSNRKIWWVCNRRHSWKSSISSRASGCGCPFCYGRLATPEHNFALKYPKLICFWDTLRNGKLKPDKVTPSSRKLIWWKCPQGHRWKQVLRAFVLTNNNCPICSGKRISDKVSLQSLKPLLALEWNRRLNGNLKPFSVHAQSNKKVWWKCRKGHEWQATVASRTSGNGCIRCAGKIATPDRNLDIVFPHIASDWNFQKNTDPPSSFTPFSNKKVWWRCSKGHEWKIGINARVKGNNCPFCAGKLVCTSNSLAALNPDLASQWNPANLLKPEAVRPNSHKKVLWLCSKGHEWSATIASRNQGRGCPMCSNKMPSKDNCLFITHPSLATEWHPIKNLPLTPHLVVAGSNKKVWWKCSKGHEWPAVVKSRSNGCGCPKFYRKLP